MTMTRPVSFFPLGLACWAAVATGGCGAAQTSGAAQSTPDAATVSSQPEPEPEVEPVEVAFENMDNGRSDVRELASGQLTHLARMRYPYAGEERIEWSFADGALTVNGRVVGLHLRNGEALPDGLVERHRGTIRALEIEGEGRIGPELAAAVEALAADEVALTLRWSGRSAPGIDGLDGLSGKLRWLSLRDIAAGRETLARLEPFEELRALKANAQEVTDESLLLIAELQGLRELELVGAAITDAGLRNLAGLSELRRLDIASTDVGDAGLPHLAGLPRLRELRLTSTAVTDTGLAHLARLPQLRALNLSHTGIGDGGLEQLSGLSQLRELYLEHTPVTDAGLAHIAGLAALRILDLANTRIGDAGLVHLANLTELRRLTLDGTQAGDSCATHLAGLSRLRELRLYDTQVTAAGGRAIREAIPDCHISGR